MNEPITFTLEQVITGFFFGCSGITAVCVATSWLIKAWNGLKNPSKVKEQKTDDRFKAIEQRVDSLASDFVESQQHYNSLIKHYHLTRDRHDDDIRSLFKGQMLLLEVQRASIDFKLNDGTDKSKLQEMDAKIDSYLSSEVYKNHGKACDEEYTEDEKE